MLDPRIYRMSLLLPALALLVLAFSLTGEPGARQSSLAPVAFDGANVAHTARMLQGEYPQRSPGSQADRKLAAAVAARLRASAVGFSVTRDGDVAATAGGNRSPVNVIATRPGTSSGEGAIVVAASRAGSGRAGLAGTAMLLELGRVLGGETLQRTVVLASVDGVAGARRLAQTLPGPIDAVVMLGDVGTTRVRSPVVLPWSGREALAPASLRNTVASAFSGQTGIRAGDPHILSQLAHLAFPLTLSAQAPFADRGIPAVELSMSGERNPGAGDPAAGRGRLGAIGQGVLSAVSALDASGSVAAPSAYVIVDNQVVPSWAIALFVLSLILPVVLTTVDGLARARRRRYPLGRALRAVLAAACPFLAAVVVLVIGGVVGALPAFPDALAPGAVAVSGGAIAVMVVGLLAALACVAALRPAFASVIRPGATGATGATDPATGATDPARPARPAVDGAHDGIAAATMLVLCVVVVVVWIANPFAAALLIPALHLWLWAVDSDLPLPALARLVMIGLGVLPTAGIVVFYAHLLGFDGGGLAWEAVLLLSGHATSWVAAIEWSVALGCLLSATVLVLAGARRPEPVLAAVSVRGPIGYAGPGSLGGTKSALRR
jgi:hypothetical protein